MNEPPATPKAHLTAKPVNSMLAELDALRDLERAAANALAYLQTFGLTWTEGARERLAIAGIADEIVSCLERVSEIRRPGHKARRQ